MTALELSRQLMGHSGVSGKDKSVETWRVKAMFRASKGNKD
jgi:hypothetical protein